jgi:uncharacterized protein YecE (DUF72 family)
LPYKHELEYAASVLNSIEINGTHYSMKCPKHFAQWAEQTPAGFIFAVKGPRFITHMLKLKGADAPLANFFASGLLRLGAKLGPILWQLPERLHFDAERVEKFLALLPRDTDEAAALGRRHNDKLKARAWLKCDPKRRVRHAIEIRHESFRNPEFVRLLRKFNVALVCADAVAWPRLMDLTSDFVYCRLHGTEELYTSGYDDHAIAGWARRVVAWARGAEPTDAERVIARPARKRARRDVFIYFDNDAKVRAPFDAQALRKEVTRLMTRRCS